MYGLALLFRVDCDKVSFYQNRSSGLLTNFGFAFLPDDVLTFYPLRTWWRGRNYLRSVGFFLITQLRTIRSFRVWPFAAVLIAAGGWFKYRLLVFGFAISILELDQLYAEFPLTLWLKYNIYYMTLIINKQKNIINHHLSSIQSVSFFLFFSSSIFCFIFITPV